MIYFNVQNINILLDRVKYLEDMVAFLDAEVGRHKGYIDSLVPSFIRLRDTVEKLERDLTKTKKKLHDVEEYGYNTYRKLEFINDKVIGEPEDRLPWNEGEEPTAGPFDDDVPIAGPEEIQAAGRSMSVWPVTDNAGPSSLQAAAPTSDWPEDSAGPSGLQAAGPSKLDEVPDKGPPFEMLPVPPPPSEILSVPPPPSEMLPVPLPPPDIPPPLLTSETMAPPQPETAPPPQPKMPPPPLPPNTLQAPPDIPSSTPTVTLQPPTPQTSQEDGSAIPATLLGVPASQTDTPPNDVGPKSPKSSSATTPDRRRSPRIRSLSASPMPTSSLPAKRPAESSGDGPVGKKPRKDNKT